MKILCPECGDPIEKHNEHSGCESLTRNDNGDYVCRCWEKPSKIAEHAVAAAIAEAEKIITALSQMSEWSTLLEANVLRKKASAYLAAHPRTEDVRAAGLRDIEYALKEEPVTSERAKELLGEMSELGVDIRRDPPTFGGKEWFRDVEPTEW